MMPNAVLFPADRGNYGSRFNHAVDLVILHATQGAFHSALIWFANPQAKASAHYVVSKEGRVAQAVPEGDCAWHAGNADYNRRSIGVELEGYVDQPACFALDSLLLHAAADLVANICQRHGVSVDREHILGHCDVPNPHDPSKKGGLHGHTDPGPSFPWVEFLVMVKDRLQVAA